MTTVDVLETRYVLKDNYTRTADSIGAATERMGSRARAAESAFGRLKGALALLGTGAAAGLGASFLRMSGNMEQYRLTLTAMTGSAEAAASKLEFLKKAAIPSSFTADQLIQAGVQLEAFGLRVERVIPSLIALGQAFDADQEHLMTLVRMFGQLSAGKFPELEQLTAFGLNKQMFEREGVKFDSQGQLLSSAQEAMEALERIVADKYGSIFDLMADSQNARMGSLMDSWNQFSQAMGDALKVHVMPAVEGLTNLFKRITESGGVNEILQRLKATMQALATAIRVAVSAWLAWNIVSWGSSILTFSKLVWDMGRMFIQTAKATGVLSAAITALQAVIPGVGWGAALVSLTLASLTGIATYYGLGYLIDQVANAMKPPDTALPKEPKPGEPPKIGSGGQWWSDPDAGVKDPKVGDPSKRIADSTANTARNTAVIARHTGAMLDLRRYALGGGDLGAIGVTAAEMGGGVGRGGRRYTLDMKNFDGASFVHQEIWNALNHLARQGLFNFGSAR